MTVAFESVLDKGVTLKPFGLTHALYESSSRLAYFWAFVSVTHFSLVSIYVGLFYANRELLVALMGAGQLLNEILNSQLKAFFRQHRPENPMLGLKSYGMPSAHSQFVGYFFGFSVAYLVRLRQMPGANARRLKMAFLWIYALSMCYSRVALGYHTPFQVIVGLAIGYVMGQWWFRTIQGRPWKVVQSLKAWLVQTFKIFGLRDSYAIWLDGGQAQWSQVYEKVLKEKEDARAAKTK